MTAKRSYNRFFIIFQEEDKGYGMGPDRPPTGYVKVETKNDKSKVTAYVQNLRPVETGDCLYKCYLISHRDDKDNIAYLGIMNIDDLGRGESTWETSAEDAFDTKAPIEKFNCAVVIADRSDVESVIAPLAGYMSKEKFEWRTKLHTLRKKTEHVNEEINETQADHEVKKENADLKVEERNVSAQKDSEAEKFAEYEEKIESIIEDKSIEYQQRIEAEPEAKKTGEVPGAAQDKRSTAEAHEEIIEQVTEEERHKHEEECKKEEHEKIEEYHIKNDCRHAMKKVLENILADYEEKDKHKDFKNCRFWKVNNVKYMRDYGRIYVYPCYDLVYYPMMYNPYIDYYSYIRKHGHYLFGIMYNKDGGVKNLIFAIPGKNTSREQPYMGKTGFTRWITWSGKDGYWIMVYDPLTGIIKSV